MTNKVTRSIARFGACAFLAAALLGLSAERVLADGTEILGQPSIPIAEGTGIVAAGVGLKTNDQGVIDLFVPGTVQQALLYWSGEMIEPDALGPDTINVDGTPVLGTLIGGPSAFFAGDFGFTAYRADITDLVAEGDNTLFVELSPGFTQQSNGAGLLVIYDDGSGAASIDVRDGLDLAFMPVSEPQKSTVPQTFMFPASDTARVAQLDLFFGSVATNRPNQVVYTVGGVTTELDNILVDSDGPQWDTRELAIEIPAGATSLTVEAISADPLDTGFLPASLSWVTAGLSVPPPAPRGTIGDFVWEDCNGNGIQDDAGIDGCELGGGIPGVPVELREGDCAGPVLANTTTGMDGDYLFTDLAPGDYCVQFPSDPPLDCGDDSMASYTTKGPDSDAANDSNANPNGSTDPIDLDAGETNLTIDAGVFCSVRIGDTLWNDLNRNGIQDMLNEGMGEPGVNEVTVTLFDCDGNQVGAPTITGPAPADAAPPQVPGGAGWYQFEGLVPGCYVVQFDQPEGFVFSPANQGGDPALDSNVNAMGATGDINLLSRDSDQTIDAGINRPPTAGLGDFVFEDENANGIQDPNEPGIPGVPVTLLTNPDGDSDCDNGDETIAGSTVTDGMGMYMFEDLEPGDYCVQFDKSVVDCTTDGFELGAPSFSPALQGSDPAADSNPDPASGVTGNVNLEPDEFDPTIDAGIFCPAKLGDRVFKDCNGNGIQDDEGLPGCESGVGIPDVEVKLFDCAGNAIVENGQLVTRTTDANGFYMFGGEPGVFDLKPGEYVAQFDPGTFPPDFMVSPVGEGMDDALDSDCMPPGGDTVCTPLGSRGINLDRDCGLIPPPPPECDLVVNKTCRVEPVPPSGDLECEAKIAATVLRYIGQGDPAEVTVTGKNKDATVDSSFEDGILTIDARPEDLGSKMTITTDGVAEVIHTSCSTPYVAGRPAPLDSPKGAPSPNWFVISFVDKEGNSVSIPDNGEGGFTDECSFSPAGPSCETTGKPDVLTFRYLGDGPVADCTDNAASRADKKPPTCSGNLPAGATVMVSVNKGSLSKTMVAPGETFGLSGFGSETELTLTGGGGSELDSFHTSCSAPLEAGDVFGNLLLVAFDGAGSNVTVTYQYEVTNLGDPVTNITVVDDKLGNVGVIPALPANGGDSAILQAVAEISETTTNTATATGMLNGEMCAAPQDSVTVTAVEPTCNVSITLDKLDDDKIKWELTNNSAFGKATLQTLTLDFPSDFDAIKKVKLNGDIYKANDSNIVVGPGDTIGEDDWTEDKVEKRQIELGKTETLEVEFEEKDKNARLGDFDLLLGFEEGCMVQFSPSSSKDDTEGLAALQSTITEGSGGLCSAARLNPEDRFGLFLFAGALLLWSRRRRRTVGSRD